MKKIAALMAIAAIALPQSAIADGFVTNKAGIKSFVFTGLPLNQAVPIQIVGWPKDKATTPNACGLTIVAPTTGATIMMIAFPSAPLVEAASLPVQTIPTCSGGVLAEPRTANFRTSTGSVVLINQTAGTIRIVQQISRTIKSNGCGIAKLNPPKQTFAGGWWFEGGSFNINNQSLYADDLLGVPEMSICRTVGTQKVTYVPFVSP